MFHFHSNRYAEWRIRSGLVPVLHDAEESPPEKLLQAVWYHQRLQRERLRVRDGRALTVLHPGFWNASAGPDFRDAVLQFEGEPPRTADVEVDLRSNGWHSHHHDTNPAYGKVGLHVVWSADRSAPLPTLDLQPVLDAPLAELAITLGSESVKSLPLEFLGRCCAPLNGLPREKLDELLHEAAHVRLQNKAAQFQARARVAGWEQALWEGLFRALGYKPNAWPMQRLGELRERLAGATGVDAFSLQARLLGVGGLLPDELTRAQAGGDTQLRRLWDSWWRERDSFSDCALPKGLWKFSGLRPANHPQRRLALAAHWLADGGLPTRLKKWCAASSTDAMVADSLMKALAAPADDYWSWHWTLRSKRLAKAHPLLGATRVTDLAMNVVLPWLWVRALEGRSESLRQEMERRYFAWPSAEDNSVLKLARERLLGTTSAKGFSGAALQQGLMQVVRDFCQHSNALCADCRFPDLVRQWPR